MKLNPKRLTAEAVKSKTGFFFVYLLVILLVAFTALPLIYLVNTAFKPLNELYLFPPTFFVKNPTLHNFRDLLLSLSSSAVPYTRYVFNSLFITLLTVFGTIIVSTFGAYGMVKQHPAGSKAFFQLILIALMFSPYVTQVSRYLLINKLGMIDHYSALIIPAMASAYYFFLAKQFIEQIPNEMIEAGRVDGAGEIRIYWQLIMPMLRPAWSTMFVFCFVATWNDYFSPLIYLNDAAMKTLPLALNTISGGTSSIGRAGAVSASTLLMTLPTILVFSLMQRKVMQTMIYSGIKG